jgi:AcrR family transcriptional regulator
MSTTKRPRGRPRDEGLAQRRREEILDAAAKMFAERGYPNTDLQLVARELGVGKGTLYRYFPSKQDLFLASVDRGVRLMQQAVEASLEGLTDPLQRLARSICAYLAFFREHPQFAELQIQERAEFRGRRKPVYFETREARRAPWRDVFRGLIAAGQVRDVPIDRIMDVLGDLVYGTMFTRHFSGRLKPDEEQARDILDIAFHGILTEAGQQRVHEDDWFQLLPR